MREMPVTNVLGVLDVDELTDLAFSQQAFDGAEERAVTQHMSYGYAAAGASGGCCDGTHAGCGRCNRFLEQQVVTELQRRYGGLYVQVVRCGDHPGVDNAADTQQFPPDREDVPGRVAMPRR